MRWDQGAVKTRKGAASPVRMREWRQARFRLPTRLPSSRPRCPPAAPPRERLQAALEATQGQMYGFFSQLPYKCYLEKVASVGD